MLQLPPGLTLSSTGSSLRPFAPLPPSLVSSAVLPLRSRPFRTPLLGLCFFLSLLQASASQWLPLCRPTLRSPSFPQVPFLRSARRFLSSAPAPHFFSPLGSLLWFVFLLRSLSRRPLSVSLVRFAPDLVLGSAALPFTAPGFASQLLLPFAFPPSQVWAFPFASFVSVFPPFTSGFRFPFPSSALGSGYWAHRYTLKTEHRLFILQLYLKTSLSLRFGQAFGLLVSVSYTHYCASTSDLSTT